MLSKSIFESIYKMNEADQNGESNTDSQEFGDYYTDIFIRTISSIPGAKLDYRVIGDGAENLY